MIRNREALENIKRTASFIQDGGRLVGGMRRGRSGGEGPNCHTMAWLVSELKTALAQIAALAKENSRLKARNTAVEAENEGLKAENSAAAERRRRMVARGYRDEPSDQPEVGR